MKLLSCKTYPERIKSTYQALNSKSFEEYRVYKTSTENLSRYSDFRGSVCILCPKPGESGVIIESLDGCFGLARKKSAGKSFDIPLHKDQLFADQDDVDNFVDSYSKSKIEAENDCNEFQSGEISDSLRSKGKNKLFDVKGVFGRVCRHGIPRGFVNMKHGERLAYAVYELRRLYEQFKDEDISLLITYDIACKLQRHLQVNGYDDFLKTFKFAIPAMHCYGHKMSCQIIYNPRRLKGFGLTDGEAIERLWSYLRSFASMTKEMTPTHRINLLTDALLHVAFRKNDGVGKELFRKLERCDNTHRETLLEISKLEQEIDVPSTKDFIHVWQKEEESAIFGPKRLMASDLSTWRSNYVNKIISINQMRNQLAYLDVMQEIEETKNILAKIKRVDVQLKTIEQRKKINRRWKRDDVMMKNIVKEIANNERKSSLQRIRALAVERLFLCNLKTKYADGQAIAARISKQINKTTSSLKKLITKYNAELSCLQGYCNELPNSLKFNDVKDPNGPVYKEMNMPPLDSHDEVPLSMKQKLLGLHLLIERCHEEKEMLHNEIYRYYNFLRQSSEMLSCQASQLQPSSLFDHGLKCRLLKKALELRYEIRENRNLFLKIGMAVEINDNEIYVAQLSISKSDEILDEISNDSVSDLSSRGDRSSSFTDDDSLISCLLEDWD